MLPRLSELMETEGQCLDMTFERENKQSFKSSSFGDPSDFSFSDRLFSDNCDPSLFGEKNLPRQHKTQEFNPDFTSMLEPMPAVEHACRSVQLDYHHEQPAQPEIPYQEPQPDFDMNFEADICLSIQTQSTASEKPEEIVQIKISDAKLLNCAIEIV